MNRAKPDGVNISPTCFPNNKASGPDDLTAELLKAGGEPLARLLVSLFKSIAEARTVPKAWKGGRLVKLFKGKGDPAECDSSRGLLIGDVLSKLFTGLLAPHVQDRAESFFPEPQAGCVKGKGTSWVSHTSRLFLENCRKRGKPVLSAGSGTWGWES